LYQQAAQSLRRDAAEGRIQGVNSAPRTPAFRERGLDEEFVLQASMAPLDYYVSGKQKSAVFRNSMCPWVS